MELPASSDAQGRVRCVDLVAGLGRLAGGAVLVVLRESNTLVGIDA
jgi:hypothetical protein